MFDVIRKLRASPETSQALRAALAETDAALPDAEAAVRKAEQERAAGLLDLDDRSIEKIEVALALAIRNRDRLRVTRDELERRAGAAEEAEFLAALNNRRAAIDKRAAAFAARLPAEYDKLAAPLVALLVEYLEIDIEVAAVNQADAEAVGNRRIEPRVRVPTLDERANEHRTSVGGHFGFLEMTSLRPGKGQPGWGGAREAFKLAGLKQ